MIELNKFSHPRNHNFFKQVIGIKLHKKGYIETHGLLKKYLMNQWKAIPLAEVVQ